MSATTSRTAVDRKSSGGGVSAIYLRESTLLVLGKTIAQAVEFGLQLFLVHYFSKSAFGAFGYALSIVFLCRAIALFEMPLALARFIPSYRERRQSDAVLGSVVLGIALVLGLGTCIAVGIVAGVELLDLRPTGNAEALRLLAVLALFIPLDALDILLTALFATFGLPRLIFFRQAVLGPVTRLLLVLVVVETGTSITGFAVGYVVASAATLLVYGGIFVWLVAREPALRPLQPRRLAYPARETLGFAAPLLASTLVWLLLDSTDGILLGHFRDIREVAAFRAVLPLALLNQGVILAATALYSPAVARLIERREHDEVTKLYWRSTLWITVASFPIFVATFCFAPSMTVGVLGDRYAGSAPILAVLAAGYFFHSALGFNGLTLRVMGRVRYSVSIDVGAAIVNLAVNLILIPRWGALGAAIGTSATLIVHNLLKQVGLCRYAGMRFLERSYVRTYASLVAITAILLAAQRVLPQSVWLALAVSSAAGVAVAWRSRRLLDVGSVFPEARRLRPRIVGSRP